MPSGIDKNVLHTWLLKKNTITQASVFHSGLFFRDIRNNRTIRKQRSRPCILSNEVMASLFFFFSLFPSYKESFSAQHPSDSHGILILDCIEIPSPPQPLKLDPLDIKMLLNQQSCGKCRDIHTPPRSSHKNHMQKKTPIHSKLGSDSFPSQKRGRNCCFSTTVCQKENAFR